MDNFDNIHKNSCHDICKKFILPWVECKHILGRLELRLIAMQVGNDLQVVLYGGEAHIGATAMASPGEATRVIICSGHREDEIALQTANILSKSLECTVCASVGIHYDNILKEEIESLNIMATESTFEALKKIKNYNKKTNQQRKI